jgi:TonB-linked SusC/RagA family outer membrane protein
MKKIVERVCSFYYGHRKKLLIMRNAVLILLISAFQVFATGSYSQTAQLSLKMKDATIKDVLAEIENQSEFYFLYNSELIDVTRKVDISVKNEKVNDILSRLFSDNEVNVSISDRHIVLTPVTEKSVAQQKSVSGKVTDSGNQPLPGVTVVIKGTTNGTVTNVDGNYTLSNTNENSILQFSFVGMKTQEIAVGDQTSVNVVLAEESIGLDEVVAIGYGTRKKETLTGAISKVAGAEMKTNPSPNLTSSLGGKIPGVISINYSGQPGEDYSKILIRGLGTLGNNNPLIIVDGIEVGSIDRIDPNDIESLTVLKDASAAIYGSKAANGVIIVTTKRGSKGKAVVEYGYSIGLGQPTTKPEIASAYEYNKYVNAYYVANNEADKQMSDTDLEKLKTGSDPDNYFANTDWWNAVVRDFAPIQRHTASIRGGTDELKYFASVGYLDQQSVFIEGSDHYDQKNYRVNLDWQLNPVIKLGINLDGRFEEKTAPNTEMRDIWWMAQATNPRYPVYFSNGLPWEGKEDGWNPVMMASDAGGTNVTNTNSYRNIFTYEVKIPWVEGLFVDGWYSMSNGYGNNRRQQYPWTVYGKADENGVYPPTISKRLAQISLTEGANWNTSETFNAKLNYVRKFGKHDLNVFVAYEQNKYKSKWISAYRNDIISTAPDAQLFMGAQLGQVANGSAYQMNRQNFFSRLSYNYSNKYYVDLTYRIDGSPIFPEDKRFGKFPGVSASWRISEEEFMNDVSFVNNLKLRGSWGQLGNDRVAEYQYLTAYNYVDGQVIMGGGHNLLPAFYPGVNANPNITWEVADNKNIGFEAGLWENLIAVEFDLYNNSRKNILIPRNASIPDYVGLKLPEENLGKMKNSGFEILLTHNKQIGDFRYSISGNYSYNTNEVVFIDETPNVLDWQKRTGKPYGAELYYKTDGLYTAADIADANVPKYGGAKAGDIKIVDYKPDGVIDGDDRVREEKSLDVPRIMYGFGITAGYKAFDLNMVFQGAGDVYRYLYTADIGIRGNFLKEYYTDYWSEATPEGRWPKANPNTFGSTNNNDFFVLPAGYLRLSSMEIGFNVPKDFAQTIWFENIRIYFNTSNPFLVYNKLKYFDPELAESRGYYYPRQRIFNFGVNVSF